MVEIISSDIVPVNLDAGRNGSPMLKVTDRWIRTNGRSTRSFSMLGGHFVFDFRFLCRSLLSSISGRTRCQSTFTLGWSIFLGFVFLFAPRPFTFDLGALFISTLNLTVSVLQDSIRAGCGT